MKKWKYIFKSIFAKNILLRIKRSKLTVNNGGYTGTDENYIKSLSIDISGNKIVKDFPSFTGDEYAELQFPNFTMEGSSTFSSIPSLNANIEVPIQDLKDNKAFIEVDYRSKGKNKKLIIYSEDFKLQNKKFRYGNSDAEANR